MYSLSVFEKFKIKQQKKKRALQTVIIIKHKNNSLNNLYFWDSKEA